MGDRTTRTIRNVLAASALLALTPPAHAGTLHVATNGVDAVDCGAATTPCRGINRAIANAMAGDRIVVGPGVYYNEVIGALDCDCMLAVNKPVTLESSEGAAVTVIDGRDTTFARAVLINTDAEFGRPGRGFTVTRTNHPVSVGIQVTFRPGMPNVPTDVKVRGNQIVATPIANTAARAAIGIDASGPFPGQLVIDGNQVIGWVVGIETVRKAATVRKNVVVLGETGITSLGPTEITSNVVVGNARVGIQVSATETVVGNSALGNVGRTIGSASGIEVEMAFDGLIRNNNFFGNGPLHCGLSNDGIRRLLAADNYWGAATGPGPDPVAAPQ